MAENNKEKIINMSNIHVGQVFKNYKTLCQALGEPIKAGDSKKAQIKEWERYFLFKRDGHKYIITEIFETPKEKQDKRLLGNSNVAEYMDYIETLLLNLFAEKAQQGQRDLLISKGKLLKLIKAINSNYLFFRDKTKKLSEYINIPEIEIKDFYESSDSTLTSNIETALKRLRQKSLIYWTNAIGICYVDTDIETNELGKIKIYRYKKNYYHEYANKEDQYIYEAAIPNKPIKKYRKATNEEIEMIINTEIEVAEKYGIEIENDENDKKKKTQKANKHKYEIHKRRLHKDYYREVNEILFKKANILYYYNAYEIVLNRKHINKINKQLKEKLEHMEKELYEKLLNDSIKDRIIENATKRHEKALAIDEDLFDWGYFTEHKEELLKARRKPEYIENTKTLTDTLIDKDKKRINDYELYIDHEEDN